MRHIIRKIIPALLFLTSVRGFAQLPIFNNRDRKDNLEEFDEQKFSWGFFLVGNYYDYKLVADPTYGMSENKKQNLVTAKGSSGFGAGLIGRMRISPSFDLRLEPGLQFVQRDLVFDTQSNDRFSAGTMHFPTFLVKPLTDAYKNVTVKSTYIDLPLLVEYHGDRWYNSRPYVAMGVNYLANIQSNESSPDDNSTGVFRSTTHNFGWSIEAGLQFYFKRFKLTPGFRGTFFINNELVKDNPDTPPYWTVALSSVQSRVFMFTLKFE